MGKPAGWVRSQRASGTEAASRGLRSNANCLQVPHGGRGQLSGRVAVRRRVRQGARACVRAPRGVVGVRRNPAEHTRAPANPHRTLLVARPRRPAGPEGGLARPVASKVPRPQAAAGLAVKGAAGAAGGCAEGRGRRAHARRAPHHDGGGGAGGGATTCTGASVTTSRARGGATRGPCRTRLSTKSTRPVSPAQMAALRREAQQRREEGMAAARARKERMLALAEEAKAKARNGCRDS
jgi:hypothetical protein